jgi:class 3 adenylate cyclase
VPRAADATAEARQRKLTAILFTDIKDFTLRMNQSEALGLRLVAEHNRIMDAAVLRHGGTVVKSIGDAYLVTFESAVTATECALEALVEFAKYNSNAAKLERLDVRLSIHSGDVIFENGDVIGDAVNLASRLQGVTEPGSICVSREVAAMLRGKLSCEIFPLGMRSLKGISEPQAVFRVAAKGTRLTPVATASPDARPSLPASAAKGKPLLLTIATSRTWLATTIALFFAFLALGQSLLPFFWPLEIVNYLIHTSGQLFAGLGGNESTAAMGGLLAQAVFPLVLAVHFFRNDLMVSSMASTAWLGESLLGLGVRMRAPVYDGSNLAMCQTEDFSHVLASWTPGAKAALATLTFDSGCALLALGVIGAFLAFRKRT